ncbi:hypothetical protein ABZ835_00735 [Streptomyces sp. NPDC047461]|uniref:hypothetical protein n=1 Tax=Streptomyces sp. NPDC047461 TaxID=3155619 RepID=UPI0033C10829
MRRLGVADALIDLALTVKFDEKLEPGFENDMAAALTRTAVTTVDDDIRNILAEGNFRAWKVYLHPTQSKTVERNYSGPARVRGGPGTSTSSPKAF